MADANKNIETFAIQVNPDGTFDMGGLDTLIDGAAPSCSKEAHETIDELTKFFGFTPDDNEAARRRFTTPIAQQATQKSANKQQIR